MSDDENSSGDFERDFHENHRRFVVERLEMLLERGRITNETELRRYLNNEFPRDGEFAEQLFARFQPLVLSDNSNESNRIRPEVPEKPATPEIFKSNNKRKRGGQKSKRNKRRLKRKSRKYRRRY